MVYKEIGSTGDLVEFNNELYKHYFCPKEFMNCYAFKNLAFIGVYDTMREYNLQINKFFN